VIRVRVRFHGGLWEGVPGGVPGRWSVGRRDVALPDGATVADLIRLLDLDVDARLVCLVAVNGHTVELSRGLADGDSVDLVPPIAGG